MKANKSNGHQNNNHGSHNHSGHENMIDDFKKRFFVSLVITLPIIVLSPMIQHWLGFTEALSFSGDLYLLFGLSTFVKSVLDLS